MKARLLILCVLFLLSCTASTQEGTELISDSAPEKELDLKAFKITVPKEWTYTPQEGIDSFYGEIDIDEKVNLSFDYSEMGYASHLIRSENEYLQPVEWLKDCISCQPGFFFNANQKISTPSRQQKQKYPKADYIAYLTHEDSAVIVPITIPDEIKAHHITVDTVGKYAIKTIYPVKTGEGITGVYIKQLKSTTNFQMNGRNLPLEQQEQVLKAFKTIKLAK